MSGLYKVYMQVSKGHRIFKNSIINPASPFEISLKRDIDDVRYLKRDDSFCSRSWSMYFISYSEK